jgi:hypothetical protein
LDSALKNLAQIEDRTNPAVTRLRAQIEQVRVRASSAHLAAQEKEKRPSATGTQPVVDTSEEAPNESGGVSQKIAVMDPVEYADLRQLVEVYWNRYAAHRDELGLIDQDILTDLRALHTSLTAMSRLYTKNTNAPMETS